MPKLFLIDAYALIFRSYYAFINRPMRNGAGLNTSPIFGFTKFLRDIIVRENPDYLGVAFDPKGGTFRNVMYPEYKANRSATPEDIIAAVPYIKRILDAMCIPTLEVAGFEADDVIGTLSKRGTEYGFDVYMVTPDKDYGQLVSDRAMIYKPAKGDDGIEIVDRAAIKAHYGFDNPALVADILALWGDASDNVPGVPGIGEKGAIKLVNEYGDVEQILANIDKLTPRQRESFENNRDQLRLAKRLVTIDTEVPVEFEPDNLRMCSPRVEELRPLLIELGFARFLHEMDTNPDSPFRRGNASCNACRQTPQQTVPEAPKPTVQRSADTELSLFDTPETAENDNPTDTLQGDLFDSAPSMACIRTVEHEYRTVNTRDELRALTAKLLTYNEVCFDSETSGFDPFTNHIVGLSFAVEPHKAWYVPMNTADASERLDILRPLFENERITKIGQNLKFDILFLKHAGVEVRGAKIDTMILHYLLDSESRHSMDYLARTLLGYDTISIETLIGSGASQRSMESVALPKISEYAAEDADITLQLRNVLLPKVEAEGFTELYKHIEEPLIEVLADLETAGVKINTRALADYAVELNGRMNEIENSIREMTGRNININSSKQLGEVLFEQLKIDDKPRKTKTKQYSTDEEYLQKLSDRHPIVPLILEYRGVKKLLSTYVEALPKLINPVTGRIHSSFNQAVTATGRLSSTNPNLQNIPVRDELGKPIRAAFIPSDADHVLLSVDYSQIELRLMAHLSGDKALCEAFEAGEDIHRATAAKIFGKKTDEVSDDERRRAKTANFGIIYGISAFGLAERMHVPMGEAKAFIEGYFRTYPGVKKYMDDVIAKARAQGYVTTIFGRRRMLPDIASHNANVRGLAERNAINAPIQGSAADIMKIAMNETARQFKAKGFRSQMILQVHDEIVVDTLRSELDAVRATVVEAMEGAAKLKVKLVADAGVGDNWLEAH